MKQWQSRGNEEKLNLSWNVGGNVECHRYSGKSFGSSLSKTKQAFALWYSNFTPRYLSQKSENWCPHKNLYTTINNWLLFWGNQELDKNETSLNRWMVKQTMVHPCHKTLLYNKVMWTTGAHSNLERSGTYAEWKKPISKGHILCDSMYTTFSKITKLYGFKTD